MGRIKFVCESCGKEKDKLSQTASIKMRFEYPVFNLAGTCTSHFPLYINTNALCRECVEKFGKVNIAHPEKKMNDLYKAAVKLLFKHNSTLFNETVKEIENESTRPV